MMYLVLVCKFVSDLLNPLNNMKKIIVFMSCVAALSSAAAQTETLGTLPGEFTINADGGKVQFSMGNLVYNENDNTFSFATNQSEYGSYFGWGTSGYHDPLDALNTHYLPTDETIEYTAGNTLNTTGYGPSFVATGMGNKPRDLTWNTFDGSRYANYDWGVYNPITNGGNQAGLWRTLTQKEWQYLLEHSNPKWVQIDNKWGLQLTAVDGNTVFLPAAGYRGLNSKSTEGSGEPTMHEVDEHCNYWSATAMEEGSLSAMTMNCPNSNNPNMVSYNRFNGFSVRLVKDASPAWITLSDRVNNEGLLNEYVEDGTGDKKGISTNVHLGRSLYSDGWNTLCLPFDVPANEITTTFGAACQLYTFGGATLSEDKTDLAISLTLATSITAGTAYIIQPASDVINPDFYNRIIKTAKADGEGEVTGELQFVGIINPHHLTPADKRYLFVTAGDELNWSKAGDTSSMYGMRAYFYVPGMEEATYAVAKRARLVIAPATHTPTDLNRLTDSPTPRFTKYIVNGRLVLVKEGKIYDTLGINL